MILSMTGYGDAQATLNGVGYAAEIRSLNNRYFKANIKLPESLQTFETEVEKLLRTRLIRGSVNFILRIRTTSAEAAYEINAAALQNYLDQMKPLGQPGKDFTVDLGILLALPGICQPREIPEEEHQRQWQVIEKLTIESMDKLVQMRQEEGKALRADVLNNAAEMEEHLNAIEQRKPKIVEEYQKKLRIRVDQLLASAQLKLDEDSLIREVAVYADRCDISEEITRLRSHLEQFCSLCDSREYAGRKLDFIAQEMLREANTIGSKANDATSSQHVVEIKARIDRLKEQVQNIE